MAGKQEKDGQPDDGSLPQVRAGGVLIVRPAARTFLLMRHVDRWDLPKGHAEPGEDDRTCALREMEEETGYTAAEVDLDPEFVWQTTYRVHGRRHGYGPAEKTVTIFLGRLDGDAEPRPTEHPEFAWRSWDPPHTIQAQTIDPLLTAVEAFLATRPGWWEGPPSGGAEGGGGPGYDGA